MKKIKIFLASSNELLAERQLFEREIYRKCKMWYDKNVFLHLDIWEDMTARMSLTGSQSEYDVFVREADLFVLLAHTKVGMYTKEEFVNAFGQFSSTQKPFIFTYFKNVLGDTEDSLSEFKTSLNELKHFYAVFQDGNDLWNQFNKELDRLEADGFTENKRPDITGNSTTTIHQTAEKIYNIDKIETANFS